MFRKIKKENIGKIVEILIKDYDVLAPVRKEERFVFDKIKNSEDATLATYMFVRMDLCSPTSTLKAFRGRDENWSIHL